ncbi:MAG TPA: MBL fold metallo-hydrolase [Nitrososphaerales archaeon]|nr:MBL fold metallo-hydrolase [Nitrososphaerales archaeon]
MGPTITCYGGVGEIGGNKILVRDRDTKVFLDFGTGFTEGADFFAAGITPRRVNGAGDLFEFGLLPEIPGLYSEEALQNTKLKPTSPQVDGILLSHYHSDHMGRIGYVDPRIPVYCGETTKLIHEAMSNASGSPLDGHDVRTFRTGDRFKVGTIDVQPVHVDHSIPGAYGFILHCSEGAVAYTGDFRFHGPKPSLTSDFVEAARSAKPAALVTEGTRVSKSDVRRELSEESVLTETIETIGNRKKFVFSSFRGNDVDRINTFHQAAAATGRQLVVSMKSAAILNALAKDKGIRVPRPGKDVLVYVRRKGSGKGDDKDYYKWERPFLDRGIAAPEVNRRQSELFLHLDIWNFPEIIDIRPDRGGIYIHSSSEAFNEEGEQEEEVVKNWTGHMGFSYHQIHASGHAPISGVRSLVEGIGAEKVLPVHTESPGLFRDFCKKVAPPIKGRPLRL